MTKQTLGPRRPGKWLRLIGFLKIWLKFSLLAKASLACGPVPDFETAHGLLVLLNEVEEKKEHIEIATENTILGMNEFYGFNKKSARRALVGIAVYVEPDSFKCDYDWNNPGWEECQGITDGYNIIRYYHERCIAVSTFHHEVMHVIQINQTGYFDHNHDTPGLWGGKEHDSVESEIRYRICQDICPEECAHWDM
jgi:hypothetical protein